MTDLKQLKADLTAGILAKCLDKISNCYIKLVVKGNLSITIDSYSTCEIEIDALCYKAVVEAEHLDNVDPENAGPIVSSQFSNLSMYKQHNPLGNLAGVNIIQRELDTTEYGSESGIVSNYPELTDNLSENQKYVEENSSKVVLPEDIQQQFIQKVVKKDTLNDEVNWHEMRKKYKRDYYQKNKKRKLKVKTSSFLKGQQERNILQVCGKEPPTENQHDSNSDNLEVEKTLDVLTTEKIKEINKPKGSHSRAKVQPRQYSDAALIEAMRKVYEDHMSISQAAKQCGIPVRTLNDKVRGVTPIFADPYKRRTFSREVEEEIVQQLTNIAEKTNGLTYKKIREYLTAVQDKYPKQKKIPFSSAYITKFLHRWPELQKYCGNFPMNARKRDTLLSPSMVKEQLQDFLSQLNQSESEEVEKNATEVPSLNVVSQLNDESLVPGNNNCSFLSDSYIDNENSNITSNKE